MGAGHASALYLPGTSRLHRLPPQCKLVAALAFILAVVATPREQVWAFGVYAVLLVGVARVGRVPLGVVARRLLIEAPFVAFAVLLPFVARGERVDVGPLSLSVDGLWGAFNILAKGTLGVGTTLLVAATTPLPDLLHGLDRLRVPRAFTSIAGFMFRYGDVVSGEMHRMKVARQSRGYDPRWFWQAKAVAASAGALFVRSYERGERVYLSMLSRGYEGTMPVLAAGDASRRQWASALALPLAGGTVAAAAWLAAA